MILNDIAMIAAATTRSQAYLQALVRVGIHPAFCIIFTDDPTSDIITSCDVTDTDLSCLYFDTKEPLVHTLSKASIPYTLVASKDINSLEMEIALRNLPQHYIIYSGYGGSILKEPLFHIGKQFIHIHAGLIPQYRGSTTVYYSILQDDMIAASAIFLSQGIDEGDIIFTQTFPLPEKDADIDYVYEPFVRSEVLVSTLRQYLFNDKTFTSIPQDNLREETYYIIHPVLKHLAVKKVRHMERREHSNENSPFFSKS